MFCVSSLICFQLSSWTWEEKMWWRESWIIFPHSTQSDIWRFLFHAVIVFFIIRTRAVFFVITALILSSNRNYSTRKKAKQTNIESFFARNCNKHSLPLMLNLVLQQNLLISFSTIKKSYLQLARTCISLKYLSIYVFLSLKIKYQVENMIR